MSLITVGPTKPASAPAIVSSATASTRVDAAEVRERVDDRRAGAAAWRRRPRSASTWCGLVGGLIRIVPLWTAENGPTRSVNSPW